MGHRGIAGLALSYFSSLTAVFFWEWCHIVMVFWRGGPANRLLGTGASGGSLWIENLFWCFWHKFLDLLTKDIIYFGQRRFLGRHLARPDLGIFRRYNNNVITLSENEERLVETLRTLPPAAASSLITWATQLSDLANGRPVDWSDTWTEADVADLQRASLTNFEARESEDS